MIATECEDGMPYSPELEVGTFARCQLVKYKRVRGVERTNQLESSDKTALSRHWVLGKLARCSMYEY